MTRKEAMNYNALIARLNYAGFSTHEAETLRRIEMTLHRWSEHECNGNIQRDGEDSDGKPRWYWENGRGEHVRGSVIADRERGALKRLDRIMQAHPEYVAYNQGDPRGCALYIVSKAEMVRTGHPVDAIYNNGIAVCT